MAVAFSNSSPLGESTKFPGFGTLPGFGPTGAANNATIPQSTSQNVLTDTGSAIANFATSGSPSPIIVLLGFALLLFLLKFAGEHKDTAIDPADLHIGSYNILTVTVSAIVGIASLKLLFNWIHLPGITPLVNFI